MVSCRVGAAAAQNDYVLALGVRRRVSDPKPKTERPKPNPEYLELGGYSNTSRALRCPAGVCTCST